MRENYNGHATIGRQVWWRLDQRFVCRYWPQGYSLLRYYQAGQTFTFSHTKSCWQCCTNDNTNTAESISQSDHTAESGTSQTSVKEVGVIKHLLRKPLADKKWESGAQDAAARSYTEIDLSPVATSQTCTIIKNEKDIGRSKWSSSMPIVYIINTICPVFVAKNDPDVWLSLRHGRRIEYQTEISLLKFR